MNYESESYSLSLNCIQNMSEQKMIEYENKIKKED